VDDNQREGLVKTSDARAALDAMLAGKPVQVEHTGTFGCSTKRKYKEASRLEALRKIEAQPVSVELAGADDLKRLRANPTHKLLLVNFWATWCGACVTEFPDLQTTLRMYDTREFAMVTVSANGPGWQKRDEFPFQRNRSRRVFGNRREPPRKQAGPGRSPGLWLW